MKFPGMINNVDISIKAYLQARQRIDTSYESFLALCNTYDTSCVVLSQDIEPFASIREAISWAVSLYEKVYKKEKSNIDRDAIEFMSAIKFIDNTMKHYVDSFSLYSFCRPGINISVKVDDSETGPDFKEISFTPSLLFGELEDIQTKPKWKPQRDYYISRIQGKPAINIMIKLDAILRAFYSFDI